MFQTESLIWEVLCFFMGASSISSIDGKKFCIAFSRSADIILFDFQMKQSLASAFLIFHLASFGFNQ